MPDTIGGASGAIRLNPALSKPANSGTGGATTGGNPNGATKNKSNCC